VVATSAGHGEHDHTLQRKRQPAEQPVPGKRAQPQGAAGPARACQKARHNPVQHHVQQHGCDHDQTDHDQEVRILGIGQAERFKPLDQLLFHDTS
jgi:hypothetical protein